MAFEKTLLNLNLRQFDIERIFVFVFRMKSYFYLSLIVAFATTIHAAPPTAEEACNAEMGKCKEYCKVGGKDDETCTTICSQDNSICICSTKCDGADRSCIQKCYQAVEKYCENNLPVCTGFCMTVEKKEAEMCSKECGMSKNICVCQRECKDDECRKSCLPPLPTA